MAALSSQVAGRARPLDYRPDQLVLFLTSTRRWGCEVIPDCGQNYRGSTWADGTSENASASRQWERGKAWNLIKHSRHATQLLRSQL